MMKALIYIISFVIGCVAVSIFSEDSNAQIERFPIGKTDLTLEVHKTHAHAFLAEYDFKLILKKGPIEIDSKDMTGDSGGYSRIDVWRISKLRYAFRDHGRTVCLNIDERKLDARCDAPASGTRIGHFDFDSSKRWRYISEVNGSFDTD